MSTFAYAELTSRREESEPGASTTTSSPGVRTFLDALAALVPAEVLVAHALILPATTRTEEISGAAVTTITEAGTLRGVFVALLLISATLYLITRRGRLDRWDSIRAFIPPLAFVAWTMLQKATAFDAVAPGLGSAPRYAIAVIGAVVLGGAATALAYKADQKTPPAV